MARHLLVLLAAGLWLGACAHKPQPTADLAITNVYIVDVTAGSAQTALSPRSSVLVDKGKITKILPADAAVRAEVILDGAGGYMLPALWDMHMHLFSHPELQEIEALLYAAHGVLFVRDMGNNFSGDDIAALKMRWADNAIPAPEIAAHAGAIIQHQREISPADWQQVEIAPEWEVGIGYGQDASIAAAYNLEERGADFLKPYNGLLASDLNTLTAFADERGVAVGGHVSFAVTVAQAAKAGMRSLEHARMLPFDCSALGPKLRADANAAEADPDAYRAVAQRRNDPDFLRGVVAGFDDARCASHLQAMRDADMHYVPTHVTREMDARAREPDYEASLPMAYIPGWATADWEEDFTDYGTLPPEEKQAFKAFLAHGLKVTRLAHEAGVPLMIGTDAGDTAIFPGFSVYREMAFFKQAGIPALDILKAATLTPAQFMGRANEEGSVSIGKAANVLIVKDNPLENMSTLRQPFAVVKRGNVWRQADLEAMRARARDIAQQSKPPAQVAMHRCRVHRRKPAFSLFAADDAMSERRSVRAPLR